MEEQKKRQNWFTGIVIPIAVGVALALALRQWVVSPARVPSASMYPTIPATSSRDFAYVVVNKLATELRPIHRGEVVVFHWPDDPKELFVKRVIGLPGDTVTVTENAVYINGKKLQQTNPDIAKSNGAETGTYKVPPGHYFMLGDNRPISDDSRMWVHKYVSQSAIVGEADIVLYPFNRIGFISQHV
ncbi:signal peptidase I [Alicyclobacillus sacchari]|uniref:Signal peptidase I n=1 Tax=Alicyclobacillus sacchari TaxID=392010 RepID=A0A4R8LKR9_9BACL|nr:signal peptidase I [Alicyclobacillus sacchari]TDY44024.1 signal peptidase I [Alicyclobacillus sacchari]GMA58282.1 signal peptidase I [Alicyclobacillus sacchari]